MHSLPEPAHDNRQAARPRGGDRPSPQVNGVRALQRSAGNAAVAALLAGQAPVAQRALGFEAEINLGVAKPKGEKYEGDTDLAKSKTKLPPLEGETEEVPSFTVVSDSRSAGAVSYSNVEFVSGAASVVGAQAASGPDRLATVAEELRTLHAAFLAAADERSKSKRTLGNFSATLKLEKGRKGAQLVNEVNGEDLRGTPGADLFVHYSVGVPLAGMPAFFRRLVAADPSGRTMDPRNGQPGVAPVGTRTRWARHRLQQAADFATRMVALYERVPGAQKRGSGKESLEYRRAALNGFSQLLYTQMAAFTDVVEVGAGQPKNYTAVLSRSDLDSVSATLPAHVRGFLETVEPETVDQTFRSVHQSQVQNGMGYDRTDTRQVQAPDPESGTPGTPVVSMGDYVDNALGRNKEKGGVSQENVFGGMNTIAPHPEEGATMIPMELRRLGGEDKTWDEVKTDLTNLAAWAREAYAEEQRLASTPGDGPSGEQPQSKRMRIDNLLQPSPARS
jgi:hypothetical protein